MRHASPSSCSAHHSPTSTLEDVQPTSYSLQHALPTHQQCSGASDTQALRGGRRRHSRHDPRSTHCRHLAADRWAEQGLSDRLYGCDDDLEAGVDADEDMAEQLPKYGDDVPPTDDKIIIGSR